MNYPSGPDGYSEDDSVFPGEGDMSPAMRAEETGMFLVGETEPQLIGGDTQNVPESEETWENRNGHVDAKCPFV